MNRFEKYDTQTEGGRIDGWYKILDQPMVRERLLSGIPKITSIGIGADAGFVMDPWYRQSYEPYVLAGLAHSINPKFNLTLIDANASATQSIEDGKFIYLDKIALSRDTLLQNAWLRMQREMGSSATTINTNDGTLELLEPYESTTNTDYMVSQGMERIAVPAWFREKISSGDISIVNQDVRNIVGTNDQSLIFCLNVLLHYPKDDQAIMLERMSQMLSNGKLLVLNEGKPNEDSLSVTGFRKTLFTENGGWLTDESLKNDFNLKITNRSRDKKIYTLEKI
jgi:hypothetical protein